MPRNKNVPAYRLHKASGQARVILDGRHVYLGPFGSPESRAKYARILAERFRPGPATSAALERSETHAVLTVNELLVQYLQFAQRYYVKDGSPTKELTCMKEALGPLRLLYGTSPASAFGPLKLKALRDYMIQRGLSRGVINQRVNRIKRVMKWAVSEELIPSAVFEGVRTVAGLRYGRSEARETIPVRPVPDHWVNAVIDHVAPQVATMLQLQQLTGMRPGEVVTMRACDIDTADEVWMYEPSGHKNRWRGHRRLIPLGPKGQALLRPYLKRDSDEFLFSPREAEQARNAQRGLQWGSARQTRIYPYDLRLRQRRRLLARRNAAKRPKGNRYTTDSYRRAVAYGIRRANREAQRKCPGAPPCPHWHPNQIRHSVGTKVRKQFGVEAAQVVLGHARTNVVDVYAERNLGLAIELARRIG